MPLCALPWVWAVVILRTTGDAKCDHGYVMREIEDQIERLAERYGPVLWREWGRYRAALHRAVGDALQ